MSCRRVSRELIDRIRFGDELDMRSAPHLAHLETCAACREEVGLNWTVVRQLRRALAERVAGHEPSAESWRIVSSRALAEERSFGARVAAALQWLRRPASVGHAIRATALALAVVLAVFVNVGIDTGFLGHRHTSTLPDRQTHPFLETAWVDPSEGPRPMLALQAPPPQVGIPTDAISAKVEPFSIARPVVSGLIE